MTRMFHGLGFALLLVCSAFSQQPASPATAAPNGQTAQQVPVMDGAIGPCSLELTALTADGKPVYAAKIKVHISYGFAGIRKLDLEAGTNIEGKVKFIGLPSRVHHPPLEFQASKDQLVGTATYDPDTQCQAKHDVLMDLPQPPAANQ